MTLECEVLRDEVLQFTLAGRLPNPPLALPQLLFPTASGVERWLTPLPAGLTPAAPVVLAAANPDGLLPWPELPNGQPFRLQIGGPHPAAAGVRVLFAEYDSRWGGTGYAVHEAEYNLIHEAAGDLRLHFPDEAFVLGVNLDGQPASAFAVGSATWLVSLPAAAGACRVGVRWGVPLPPTGEWVFAPPRLEGVADFPALETLHLPPRFDNDPKEERGGRNAAAWSNLRRAEGQFRLLQTLAERLQRQENPALEEQVLAAHTRFYQALRDAEHDLRVAARQADAAASSRLVALHREHQAFFHDTKWEHLRRQGEEVSKNLSMAAAPTAGTALGRAGEHLHYYHAAGTPLYFHFTQPHAELRVPFLTKVTLAARRAALGTLLFALLAGGVLGLQSLPRPSPLRQVGWPEGFLLAGGLWWLFLPAPALGLLLALIGLGRRLGQFLFWSVRWYTTVPQQSRSGRNDPIVDVN
jgi:hypothetical protein